MSRAPLNFSFLDCEPLLAGSSFPYESENIKFYLNLGIKHVITTCEQVPKPLDGINFYHIEIDEDYAEVFSQLKKGVDLIDNAVAKNEKVVVHCVYGQGRTGMLLSCFVSHHKKLDGKSAVLLVRKSRPKSVLEFTQQNIVAKFAEKYVLG